MMIRSTKTLARYALPPVMPCPTCAVPQKLADIWIGHAPKIQAWIIACVACTRDNTHYDIELSRFDTHQKVSSWTCSTFTKQWVDKPLADGWCEVIDLLFGRIDC